MTAASCLLALTLIATVYASSTAELQWTDGKGSEVPMTVNQNSEAELLCPTNAVARNITFYKDGVLFNHRAIGKILPVKNGVKLPDMMAHYDRGNYTCVVSSPPYAIWRLFIVDIIIQYRGPPEFTSVPKNQTAYEGEKAEFACLFLTGEIAYVQWVKHYMVNGSYFNDNKTAYFRIMQSGATGMERLVFANVSTYDSGWYTCIVSNKYGQVHRGAWLDVIQRQTTNSPLHVISNNSVFVALVIIGFFVIVVILIGCYVCLRRHHPKQRQLVLNQSPLYLQTPADVLWEISRQNLQLGELLGEGAFGKVYKGYALGIDGRMEPTVVAVKMLKDGAREKEMTDLLQEMETMKSIGHHINIINLLGCCTRNDGPLQVIVEFAPNGNLRDYLRLHVPFEVAEVYSVNLSHPLQNACPLPYKNLISYAFQVSRGMKYLASMKIVHRDLAARNVLVADDNVLKIADFGLTRNVKDKDYYLRSADGRLPVKWMAPESLIENRYTTKSDVWSFGIFLWEIFSFGSSPYPTVAVEQLFHLLRQGYRMDKPLHATDDIYELMLDCWRYCPHDRPDFLTLVDYLDDMLTKSVGTNYLNLQPVTDTNEVVDNEVFSEAVFDSQRLLSTDTDDALGLTSASADLVLTQHRLTNSSTVIIEPTLQLLVASADAALTDSCDSQYMSLICNEPSSSRSLSLITDTTSFHSRSSNSLSL